MKLKKIDKIVKYKSFENFRWCKYFNNLNLHEDINIFFGENGSGKSSICNILKSVSQNKSFVKKQIPKEICLKFDDGDFSFKCDTSLWNKTKPTDDIIFFDREFIHENIHLGNTRDTRKEGQGQKSGKMSIELDREAIRLRQRSQESEQKKKDIQKKLQDFEKTNEEILDFELSEKEKVLYEQYKDKTNDEINSIKSELHGERKELEDSIKSDEDIQKKIEKIQSTVKEITNPINNISISDYKEYQDIFNFKFKEKAKENSEKDLIEKIKSNKDFFKQGIEIRKNRQSKCPFCQSENVEHNVEKILRVYNNIYDTTYQEQLQKFETQKQLLIKELDKIIAHINDYDLSSLFRKLKKLQEDFKIPEIYRVKDEQQLTKPSISEIKYLKEILENLQKPNKENIQTLFGKVKNEFDNLVDFFNSIHDYISEKNKIIVKYKSENTEEKVKIRIKNNNVKLEDIDNTIKFFTDNLTEKQTRKEIKEKELSELKEQFGKAKNQYESAKKDYETYCSTEIFENKIDKMKEYFEKFNFNFHLSLNEQSRGNKKEFPFSFKVLDKDDNERDFKEGLSDGELQTLSICFFFAFIEGLDNLENKIMILDDPITSFDNSNLSTLVNLINKEKEKFSQILIFTHHKTFFKFLRKKFKKCSQEFNIIKNKPEFGGSFICLSKQERFIKKLKEFEKLLQNIPPGDLDVESKTIEYGQYLRYEVERFVKNNLLHWNKDKLPQYLKGIKENQNYDEEDFEILKDVYSFCNWTTSHVDSDEEYGLESLKRKIEDFLSVVNK